MESGRGCEKSQRSWIRRCWTVVEIFSVILTAVFVLVVVQSLLRNTECEVKSSSRRILTDESTKRLESICNVTLYSDQCYSTLMSVNSTEPRVLFRASLIEAVEEHVKILGFLSKLVSSDESVKSSLKVCDEMIGDALECLKETIERFDEFGKAMTDVEIDEIRGTLTYAIVDGETCLEGFDEVMEFDFSSYQRNIELIKSLRSYMKKGKELVSNSLAIVTKILGGLAKQVDKSLLGSSNMVESLLSCHLTPNVTVAKDGTGNYRTISEAVASIPETSRSRFVIHVKEGKYFENVNVLRNKFNVVVYGDGITKTIVSSNLNRHDKPKIPTTFQTATFSVSGRWFVVRDMKFVNTAGPRKEQAVAFHSNAKHSVMYRCAFEGYQDTLYARAGMQLYRDCDIVGTVDFIFGHAAAVFQNCTIRPRQPLHNQFNTITAQSGVDEANTISGFSIVNSKISPFQEDLTVKTYLGRPWNVYSTVVVMKTQIEKLIDPNGWVSWNNKSSPPTTISYGEYMNYGPGSDVGNRVKWIGYQPKMTNQEAHKYTVDALINHNGWLRHTCVPYNGSL
ncbi:Pectinesterase 1 [Cardamine amara subsp. amara]|uniref:Pectinesterase n=1 Tax=Cardamine amara subsp. amara TaxID=228776 RepID=A0ABD1B1Q3_CARAN